MMQEQIRDKVKKLSDEIHAIKFKHAKFEKRKVWDPVKRWWAYDQEKKTYVEATVQVSSINPASADWPRYVLAKREVSVLLTARLILKFFGDDPEKIKALTKAAIKEAISKKELRCHAKRPSNVAFGALRALKKLCKGVAVLA
jgi:hypothetical protein